MVNGINSLSQQMSQLMLNKINDGDSDDIKTAQTSSQNVKSAGGRCNPCTGCGLCSSVQNSSDVTPEQLKSPIDLKV